MHRLKAAAHILGVITFPKSDWVTLQSNRWHACMHACLCVLKLQTGQQREAGKRFYWGWFIQACTNTTTSLQLPVQTLRKTRLTPSLPHSYLHWKDFKAETEQQLPVRVGVRAYESQGCILSFKILYQLSFEGLNQKVIARLKSSKVAAAVSWHSSPAQLLSEVTGQWQCTKHVSAIFEA